MKKNRIVAAGLSIMAVGPMVAVAAPALSTSVAAHAAGTTIASRMSSDLIRLDNPTTGATLLTAWNTEAASSAKYGFQEVTRARISQSPQEGLSEVHRLYKKDTNDFIWSANPTEISNAVAKYGYVDQGVNFYAATRSADGLKPVYRLLKGGHHKFVLTSTERLNLLADGWTEGHVVFYVTPAVKTTTPTPTPSPVSTDMTRRLPVNINPAGDADGKFTFAVMPDTQKTSTNAAYTDFAARSNWLVANKDATDLRFVTHNGDITNWGERDASQYANAMKGFNILTSAGIPWSVSLGNHDTGAIGWNGVAGSTALGGAAYKDNPLCHTDPTVQNNPELVKMAQERYGVSDPCITQVLVRETTDFNSYFKNGDMGAVEGAYEPGKADNTFSTFEAAGKKWLMLNTEFVPRAGVLNWMEDVVKNHPDHNVIIITHSYIDGYGNIITSAEYGETSGKMIEDRIVSKYANVKAVFSGHVGNYTQKVYTYGDRKVPAFLQTLHPVGGKAPTRMVEVDAVNGTISTKIVDAKSGEVFGSQLVTGLSFN